MEAAPRRGVLRGRRLNHFAAPEPGPGLLDTSTLLERIRGGESEAYNELFDRYRSRLDVFLRSRLPPSARHLLETQDLVQEVCIRTLPNLERFDYRGIGSFWAYLRKIALNHAAEVWRKYASKLAEERLNQESWRAPAADDAPPLAGLLAREEFETFEGVLHRLSEKKRYALLMRIELGLDFKTISSECDYPSANAARMDVTRTIEAVGREMAVGRSP